MTCQVRKFLLGWRLVDRRQSVQVREDRFEIIIVGESGILFPRHLIRVQRVSGWVNAGPNCLDKICLGPFRHDDSQVRTYGAEAGRAAGEVRSVAASAARDID